MLQLKEELTLDNAIQYARQAELVNSQMTEQVQGVKELEEATARQSSQRRFGNRRGTILGYRGRGTRSGARGGRNYQSHGNQAPTQGQRSTTGLHTRCNYPKHFDGSKCSANGQECSRCHRTGHFAVVCRTKPGKLTRAASEVTATASTSEGQETYFIGSIHCDDTERAWPVNLDIGGKQISFKIDSGADTTVMAEGTY